MQTTETVHLVRAAFEWSFCLKTSYYVTNVRLKCEVDSQIRFTISSHQLRASCDSSRIGLSSHSPKFSKCAVRHVPWTCGFLERWCGIASAITRSECTVCDFFPWGYLEERVFKHFPHTLPGLKDRIV